jgi:hypothetical protein
MPPEGVMMWFVVLFCIAFSLPSSLSLSFSISLSLLGGRLLIMHASHRLYQNIEYVRRQGAEQSHEYLGAPIISGRWVLSMVHALSTTCRLSVSFVCVATCRYLVPLEGPDGPYLCGGATQAGFFALFYSLCFVHQCFSVVHFRC